MTLDDVTTLDFETYGIQPRPAPSPEPVGLAIRWPGGQTEYLSWGHPNGTNNSSKDEAYNALVKAFRGPVVFHNAKFDLEVAWTHFGLRYPREWHDTMFLAFLDCPHAASFALKATAERVLRLAPTAQDVLHEWIIANIPGTTKKNAGAHIALAPVHLVAPYAMADVAMTFKLFERLYPSIINKGMGPAYNRERRLMPWLLDAEARGVLVDRNKLERWNTLFLRGIPIVEDQLRRRLNALDLNFDEDRAVAEAIDAAGLVDVWELTPSGQRATNKRAMERQCKDKELLRLLSLRNTASTMLKSFVAPWLAASAQDGRLHTQWNQTRSIDNMGTKTGRIGSERPNLANVPNASAAHPELPNLREAFLPEEGHTWVKADFSQQEFRIAAHFENSAIMQTYQQNATTDFHALTANLVKMNTGLDLPRKQIKNVNFCLLYGGGVPRLADVLGCTLAEAEDVRRAYYGALPGMKQLSEQVQTKSMHSGGVVTVGGRFMPVEPPDVLKGRTYYYKQLNKLVQGSAADMTKEAIIKFGDSGTPARLLITVYDEIDISVPSIQSIGVAHVLDDCMVHALPLDVPMRTDLSVGDSWGNLEDFK